ncbi:unnamed protein product [Discula destructiva]
MADIIDISTECPAIPKGHTLCTGPNHFADWYVQLKYLCLVRGIWDDVSPDNAWDETPSENSTELWPK